MKNPRVLLAAGVLIVAVVVGIVLAGAGGSSRGKSDEPTRVVRATLELERAIGAGGEPELLVSLPRPQLNSVELTGGARFVWLRCADRAGAQTIRRRVGWPLIEEEGFPPHIHYPAAEQLLNRVRSCRLTGPGIDFRALVPGRLAAAG